ncbi:DNA repair exonuclease [Corynebacterium sp. H127]|uniref:metallophosphoesterase family protein n=1 Tax=Corynebacterium sp. H127 TaxID=3133418 RepID=UPI0030A31D0B
MTEVKFLHTSDWQLGMTRWFLEGEAQARFDDARLAAVSRIGEIAAAQGCAFIVVAGDVFESNSLHRRTLGRVLEVLKALPVPVYLLPGNHDPLTADSVFYSAEQVPGVHVLSDFTPVDIVPGVQLIGAPLLSKRAVEDRVAAALQTVPDDDSLRILVGHGQVAGRGEVKPDLIDLPTVEAAIASGKISYLALGDTHSTSPVGTTGAVWFSGSPEVTDFHDFTTAGGGESNSGNVLVVSIDGTREVTVEQVPTGSWLFHAIEADLNSRADVEQFIARLDAYENKSRVAIKYGLRGTLDLSAMQLLERELERLEPVFASLKPRARHMDLVLQPEASDLEALNISGYAKDALQELLAAEDPDADAAVRLMFRLAKGA